MVPFSIPGFGSKSVGVGDVGRGGVYKYQAWCWSIAHTFLKGVRETHSANCRLAVGIIVVCWKCPEVRKFEKGGGGGQ